MCAAAAWRCEESTGLKGGGNFPSSVTPSVTAKDRPPRSASWQSRRPDSPTRSRRSTASASGTTCGPARKHFRSHLVPARKHFW
eukprot:43983-Pyramimonas_sp.AAC.1